MSIQPIELDCLLSSFFSPLAAPGGLGKLDWNDSKKGFVKSRELLPVTVL